MLRLRIFRRFIRNEQGATAIEYGLIAAIICIGIIASLVNVKNNLNTKFNTVATEVGNS